MKKFDTLNASSYAMITKRDMARDAILDTLNGRFDDLSIVGLEVIEACRKAHVDACVAVSQYVALSHFAALSTDALHKALQPKERKGSADPRYGSVGDTFQIRIKGFVAHAETVLLDGGGHAFKVADMDEALSATKAVKAILVAEGLDAGSVNGWLHVGQIEQDDNGIDVWKAVGSRQTSIPFADLLGLVGIFLDPDTADSHNGAHVAIVAMRKRIEAAGFAIVANKTSKATVAK